VNGDQKHKNTVKVVHRYKSGT